MSINLASQLSAITTDFAGVNHVVWVEDNALWHAQFDANAGTWVNAQRVVDDVPGNVTGLNLIANEKLIGGSSPGLAVIWQQGDRQNNSNFYYSAAQYSSTGQLQWDAAPTVLTVNETDPTDGLPFTNLNPRAIADNNGNVLIVGQQVNVNNAADQSLREDIDLYQLSGPIASVTPGAVSAPNALYSPPVIVNGVNQGPGTPINQTASAAIAPQTAFSLSESTTTESTDSFAATSSAPSAASADGSQGLGFEYGPELSFSTGLLDALGLDKYLFGIPKHTVESVLKQYKLDGTLGGLVAPGESITLLSQGKAVRIGLKEVTDPTTKKTSIKKTGTTISFSYQSKAFYEDSSPYNLTRIQDVLSLTANETFPIFNGFVPFTEKLLKGQLLFTGSAGISAILEVQPINPDESPGLVDILLDDAGLDAATVLLTAFSVQLFGGSTNELASTLIADAIFAPIENLLLDNLTDVSNLKVTNYLVGPTVGGALSGEIYLTAFPVLTLEASGGVNLLFGFGAGGYETTVLNIPISVGVSLGPLTFDASINPTFVWPSNPPLPSETTSNGAVASTAANFSSLSSADAFAVTTATIAPSATVLGSILTLNFDAPLDLTSIPDPSDFSLQTQSSDPSQPTTPNTAIYNVTVSNDPTTGNGVVVLYLTEAIAYSPQFSGTNPLPDPDMPEMEILLAYTGTALEFSNNTAVANFADLDVANSSPQSLAVVFNPTKGNGNDYSTANQTALLDNLEADYAQDSPPALTLITNNTSDSDASVIGDEGQILAVWSREVQPLTPIAGFVNGNEIYLNFVQALNISSTPSNSQFSVSVNDEPSSLTVTNVAIAAGGYIQLNLSETVASTDTISITYQPSTTNQTSNLSLTDAVSTTLWLPTFTEALTNTTGQSTSTAPALLGGAVIIDQGTNNNNPNNLITLVFNAPLDVEKIPNGSAFTVVNNGQTYSETISNVNVSGNVVTFNIPAPTNTPLISQGDITAVTYTPGSITDQNLTGENGGAIGTVSTQLTTLPETPTTTLVAGIYTSGSTGGLANFQNIIGTDGFNLDPAVASDTSGNALAVWVYADTSDINNLSAPGSIYTDDQSQVILDNLNQSDIYFSYWNGSQWSLAAPLATNQLGTDNNVTIAYDETSKTYIAAWLNTQQNASAGNNQVTIYWASYTPDTQTWSAVSEVLSEATPDPLTDLVISHVNGQTALFWTETQPIAYAQLTEDDNPAIYLRLGELSGTTANNSGTWGYAANGTYNGTFTLNETGALFNSQTSSGDPNPATRFENSGSITFDSALNLGSSAFSVEFWFKVPSTPSSSTNLISLDGVFSTSLNNSDANTILTFDLADGSSISTNASSNPLDSDTWYYVVGTYSNQTQELSLYLNGQPVETVDNVNFTLPTSASLTVAGGSDTVYLDEIALYGNALSYAPSATPQDLTALQMLGLFTGSNQIGEKYSTQFVTPLPPGPQTQYSLLNSSSSTASNSWSAQTQIDPIPFTQPTLLSDANTPVWDIVSNSLPNGTGNNIAPNGQQDTTFSATINGFQGKTIESITLELSNGITYNVGGSSSTTNQLGVVIGNSLINSPAPSSTEASDSTTYFNYPVMGTSLTLNLLVDTGADPSATITASSFSITFTDNTTASSEPGSGVTINLPQFIPPNALPITPDQVQVVGTATVTETEDSSLTLIDSGFILNTTNPGMGYDVVSADFNKDGLSDVAIGNRGYTNSSGTVLNNGTIQILMGGQALLLDNSTSSLAPPTSSDTNAGATGNTGGFSLIGIPDGGQANGDAPLSMATGDVNNDGYIDLVIGSPNNNTVYVIYGSYLASASAETVIDVENLNAQAGYSITAPPIILLTLDFGSPLLSSGIPSTDQFTVTSGSQSLTVEVVSLNSSTVILAVDGTSLSPSSSFTVSYQQDTGSSNNLQVASSSGNTLVPNFSVESSSSSSGTPSVSEPTLAASEEDTLFGYAVAVGNFDGSGGADIAIGAPSANAGNGEVYVAYNTPNSQSTSATSVYAGQGGEQAGYALATSAYVSGGASTFSGSKSTDDLIVGAPNYAMAVDNTWSGSAGLPTNDPNPFPDTTSVEVGAVYVFTNNNSSSLSDTPSYTYYGTDDDTPSANGAAQPLFTGSVVASNGDWNGDGYLDLAIAAPGGDQNDGTVFILSGKLASQGNDQYLNQISNLVINGGLPLGQAGAVVTSAGDVNDDSYEDFLITAPQGANGTGQGYVLFGSSSFLGAAGTIFDLNVTANDSKTTFLLNGNFPYQLTGAAASPIGDINNDGVDDLMLSAPNANQLYAVYGHPWLADDGSIKLADISGDNGFVIDGDLYSAISDGFPTSSNPGAVTLPSLSSALIVENNVLYLAYTNDEGATLQTSKNNGQTWSNAVIATSDAVNSSPAIAFYNGVLYLAYQYQETGGGLYITSSADNGSTWSTPYQVGNFGIESTPSLVVYQDQLAAFFVNPSNGDIQYVYANSSNISSNDWSNVYTVAYPDGDPYTPYQTAGGAVSTAALNNTLYLAYQGGVPSSPNGSYYVTSTAGSNLESLVWEVKDLSEEAPGVSSTSGALGLTANETTLYLSYENSSNNAIEYFTLTNGSTWDFGTSIISSASGSTPALVALDNGEIFISSSVGNIFDAEIFVISNLTSLSGNGNDVVMLGDINGDGFADVLSGGSPNGAVVIFGASTQDLLDAAAGTDDLVITVENGTIADLVALGDFNGDGLQDFGVLANTDNFYLVLGSASLGSAGTLNLDTNNQTHLTDFFQAEGVADYNGDGYDDVLLRATNGSQSLYLGDRSGNFGSPISFSADGNTVFNGIGDVNGDGYSDIGGGSPSSNIISPNAVGNGGVTVYEGNSNSPPSSTNISNISPPSTSISGTLDNSAWGFQNFGDQQTYIAPSFATFNGYLYMVYNSNDSSDLYIQRSADGYNWEGFTNLGSDFETNLSASLAVLNDQLYLAFADTKNSSQIIVTPATIDSSSALGLSFNFDNAVAVPNQIVSTDYPLVTGGLSSITYNDELYIFFLGDRSDSPILYVTSNDGINWSDDFSIGDGEYTYGQIAPTIDNGNLVIAYTDTNNKKASINISTSSDGTTWTTSAVPNQSTPNTIGPGLLSVDETLYLFFIDSTDSADSEILYVTSTNGGNTWSSSATSFGQFSYNNPNLTFFQESLLVGFAGTNKAVNISTSNPIYEPNQTQQLGQQIQNIGDFNGDGIADFGVLAPGFLSNLGSVNNNVLENNQGAVFIYYGTTFGIADNATPDLVLATPAPNPSTSTATNQAILLSNFSGAGDINGDGYDDLIIASPNTALNSNNTPDGATFVVFGGGDSLWGNAYPATTPFDLGKLTPDTAQLTLYFNTPLDTGNLPAASTFTVTSGLNTLTVESITSSNANELVLNLSDDANITDFLSVTYTQPSSGTTALTYATGTPVTNFTASNDAAISTLGAPIIEIKTYPELGFQVTGLPNSQAGISLSGGGDVNGDSFSDFIIGAPGNNDNLTYTIFGSDFNNTVSQTGTIGDDIMQGSPTGESFLAGQGDDLIETHGGADVVYAGPGNDQVTVSDTYFQRLDGGTGRDVLFFEGYNGQDWDLTRLSPGLRLRDFEILVTENYGANTLTLNSLTVTQLSPTNTVTVYMDGADTLNLSSDFSAAGTVYQYNQTFYQYTSDISAATVLVNKNAAPYLALTEQGELVLYSAGEILWTATDNDNNPITGAVQALMQTNGNFVLYSQVQTSDPGSQNYALWESNTSGNTGAYLQLDANGGLDVISANGQTTLTTLYAGSSSSGSSPIVFQLTQENQILLGQRLLSASSTNSPQPIFPESISTTTLADTNLQESSETLDTTSDFTTEPSLDVALANVNAASDLPTQIYVSNPIVSERSGKADFTLTRTGDLNKYVWVDYLTKDGDAKAGDRYNPTAGRVVFAPGETTQTVTVLIPNNGRYVGDRQFGLAVTLEGESTDAAVVPDAWEVAIATPNEQIRRWSRLSGEDGNSVLFDITSTHSPDRIVTFDVDLDGMVVPFIWNPATTSYENIPFNSVNGITQLQDIDGNNLSDLYRMKFQDGGPFDGDGIVNGLVALDFRLAELKPVEVPLTGGRISGTEGNDYFNAQGQSGTYRLEGLGGVDVLNGSNQRDVLTGDGDNDRLFGHGGVDQLFGGEGNDYLDGGLDLDLLYGGTGADNFVLRSGDGTDRIMDFNATEGDLFLLDQISFGSLTFNNNQILLDSEILAIVIDANRQPVTDFANNPQWFASI